MGIIALLNETLHSQYISAEKAMIFLFEVENAQESRDTTLVHIAQYLLREDFHNKIKEFSYSCLIDGNYISIPEPDFDNEVIENTEYFLHHIITTGELQKSTFLSDFINENQYKEPFNLYWKVCEFTRIVNLINAQKFNNDYYIIDNFKNFPMKLPNIEKTLAEREKRLKQIPITFYNSIDLEDKFIKLMQENSALKNELLKLKSELHLQKKELDTIQETQTVQNSQARRAENKQAEIIAALAIMYTKTDCNKPYEAAETIRQEWARQADKLGNSPTNDTLAKYIKQGLERLKS